MENVNYLQFVPMITNSHPMNQKLLRSLLWFDANHHRSTLCKGNSSPCLPGSPSGAIVFEFWQGGWW